MDEAQRTINDLKTITLFDNVSGDDPITAACHIPFRIENATPEDVAEFFRQYIYEEGIFASEQPMNIASENMEAYLRLMFQKWRPHSSYEQQVPELISKPEQQLPGFFDQLKKQFWDTTQLTPPSIPSPPSLSSPVARYPDSPPQIAENSIISPPMSFAENGPTFFDTSRLPIITSIRKRKRRSKHGRSHSVAVESSDSSDSSSSDESHIK